MSLIVPKQFICSKIYPEDEVLQVLYKEMLFMDYTQPFTGATFSLLMASETAKVLINASCSHPGARFGRQASARPSSQVTFPINIRPTL